MGAASAWMIVGATGSATGRICRTETWHCSQQSREEKAGPEECPCDLRQQLMLPSLQPQGMLSALDANARNGIG